MITLHLFISPLSHTQGKRQSYENSPKNLFAHRIPFCYAMISGFSGAQSFLLAKASGELVKETILGENQLIYASTYAIFAGMIITITMQTHWMNVGLQNYDALYVFPVFQVFLIVVSIIGGVIFFEV